MRFTIYLIVTLFALNLQAQEKTVRKTAIPINISDSVQRLFYRQLDTFDKAQKDTFLFLDSVQSNRFWDSANIWYYRHGSKTAFRRQFGRVGGLSCGYDESDEPSSITIRNGALVKKAPALFDFFNNTSWKSSPNWNRDTIQLLFRKGFPPLTTLIFYSGDQSSESNWQHYARPKKMNMFVDGKLYARLHFDNTISRQEFEFAAISNYRRRMVITLVVESVFGGTDPRVAISELEFDGIIH
jgi:hypothetical protein